MQNFDINDSGKYSAIPREPPITPLTTGETKRRVEIHDDRERRTQTPLPNCFDESMTHVLVNYTHTDHRPRSAYPGIRILGFFHSEEEVRSHVKNVLPASACSLFMLKTNELNVICTSTEKQQDTQYQKTTIQKTLHDYQEYVKARSKDFQDNIKKQSTGEVGHSIIKVDKVRKVPPKGIEDFEETNQHLEKTEPLPQSACIAKQSFAVVIFINDISDKVIDEPLVCILNVFAHEGDAHQYIKQSASIQYPDCDIDIVDMYGWCFPSQIDTDKLKEEYTNERLNDIMQGRKDNLKKCDQLRSWCADNNLDEPVVVDV